MGSDQDVKDPHCIEGWMENRQGLSLHTMYWPSTTEAEEKTIMLFIHGHGCYLKFELLNMERPGEAPTYDDSWVEFLNSQGIDVCGIDNQGCGTSDSAQGYRFFVESFDDYVEDVLQYARMVRDEMVQPDGPPVKMFVAGISLGGCIALNCVLQDKELFNNGMILLAPMLSLERVTRKFPNGHLLPVARFVSWAMPSLPIIATDKNTVHPEIQELWDQDPLTMHINTRVRNAYEYITACSKTMAQLEDVDVPFLVFHSEIDTMCDPDGSKTLYVKSSAKDKTLRLVNSMWHILVKESGNRSILKEIAEWISMH